MDTNNICNLNYNGFECVRDVLNGPNGTLLVVGFFITTSAIALTAINRGFKVEHNSETTNFAFSI